MNKRECIIYIKEEIKEMYRVLTKPTDFLARHDVFLKCRDACKACGYEGETFNLMWRKACDEYHREEKEYHRREED